MNIEEAERQITAVLAELEKSTGDWVEAVNIDSVDVTRMDNQRPEFWRSVRVLMKPKPGSRWK